MERKWTIATLHMRCIIKQNGWSWDKLQQVELCCLVSWWYRWRRGGIWILARGKKRRARINRLAAVFQICCHKLLQMELSCPILWWYRWRRGGVWILARGKKRRPKLIYCGSLANELSQVAIDGVLSPGLLVVQMAQRRHLDSSTWKEKTSNNQLTAAVFQICCHKLLQMELSCPVLWWYRWRRGGIWILTRGTKRRFKIKRLAAILQMSCHKLLKMELSRPIYWQYRWRRGGRWILARGKKRRVTIN